MDDSPYFLNQLSGYGALPSGSAPFRYTGFGQLPFGVFGNLAAQGFGQAQLSRAGMLPFGGSERNAFDKLRAFQYAHAERVAMEQAAQADRDSVYRSVRGMAALAGVPFGSEQRQAANALASSAAYVAPTLAGINPAFLDAWAGPRGSATVLAREIMASGRYRLDPVTGRMGLSGETAGTIARTLGQEVQDNPLAYGGLTLGRVGELASALQFRGMIAPGATDTRRDIQALVAGNPYLQAQIRTLGISPQAVASGQLSSSQFDQVANIPEIAGNLRGQASGRFSEAIKKRVDVLRAMKDIFGDAGQGDAPIEELMNGLNALTLGSASQMDPGKLADMVRKTRVLARNAGITLDGVTALLHTAGEVAGQLGLDGATAVRAAQGSLAFGTAYRAAGYGGLAAPGMMSADQMQQYDLRLREQAAASPATNRAGAVVRLVDAAGLGADTAAGRYAAAVRRGEATPLSSSQYENLFAGTAVSPSLLRAYEQQEKENRDRGADFGLDAQFRASQGGEFRQIVAANVRGTLENALAPTQGGNARTLAAGIAANVTQRLYALPKEQFVDERMRREALAAIVADEMRKQGVPVDGATAGLAAGAIAGDLTARIPAAFQGLTFASSQLAFDDGLQGETRTQDIRATRVSRLERLLGGIGQDTTASRILTAVQGTRIGSRDQLRTIGLAAIGGVSASVLNDAFTDALYDVNQLRDEVEQGWRDVDRETDPAKKAELQRKVEQMEARLGDRATDVGRMQAQFGEFNTIGGFRGVLEENRDAMTGLNDLRLDAAARTYHSARSGGSTRATAKRIAELRAANPGMSPDQLREMGDAEARATVAGRDDLRGNAKALQEAFEGQLNVYLDAADPDGTPTGTGLKALVAQQTMLEKFWSASPEARDTATSFVSSTRELSRALLTDPKAKYLGGTGAVGRARALNALLDRAQQLADRSSGGEIGRLAQGSFVGNFADAAIRAQMKADFREFQEIQHGEKGITALRSAVTADYEAATKGKFGLPNVGYEAIAQALRDKGVSAGVIDRYVAAKGDIESLNPADRQILNVNIDDARRLAAATTEAAVLADDPTARTRLRIGAELAMRMDAGSAPRVAEFGRQVANIDALAKGLGLSREETLANLAAARNPAAAALLGGTASWLGQVGSKAYDTYAGVYDRYEEARKAVEGDAKTLGVDGPADLLAADDYFKSLDRYRKEQSDAINPGPDALLSRLAKSLGMAAPKDAEAAKLRAELNDPKLRARLQQRLDRRTRLTAEMEGRKATIIDEIQKAEAAGQGNTPAAQQLRDELAGITSGGLGSFLRSGFSPRQRAGEAEKDFNERKDLFYDDVQAESTVRGGATIESLIEGTKESTPTNFRLSGGNITLRIEGDAASIRDLNLTGSN